MVKCEYVGCNKKSIGAIENHRTSSFIHTCQIHLKIVRKMIRRRYKGNMPLQLELEKFEY
jgi:hypothetical protein